MEESKKFGRWLDRQWLIHCTSATTTDWRNDVIHLGGKHYVTVFIFVVVRRRWRRRRWQPLPPFRLSSDFSLTRRSYTSFIINPNRRIPLRPNYWQPSCRLLSTDGAFLVAFTFFVLRFRRFARKFSQYFVTSATFQVTRLYILIFFSFLI